MLVITAKFKGENGSLGFKTGDRYRLLIDKNVIRSCPDLKECPYGSVESFLKNWDLISCEAKESENV